MEAVESVEWPDHSVGVRIEEGDVLLEDGVVSVTACPVALLGSIGGFDGGGLVCSCSA